MRALEKEPERRYQHASEVKTDVESISISPGHPGAEPGLDPDGPRGRPAVKRWEAWLLVSLFCATCIAALVVDLPGMVSLRSPLLPLWMSLIVLLTGAGLWGLWRFVRREPTEDFNRQKGTEGHRVAPLDEWQPWPLLALVVGLYGASLCTDSVSIGPTGIHYNEPGLRHAFGSLRTVPNWLTSFALSFGSWALVTRRWFAAGIAGLFATGSVLYALMAASSWADVRLLA